MHKQDFVDVQEEVGGLLKDISTLSLATHLQS